MLLQLFTCMLKLKQQPTSRYGISILTVYTATPTHVLTHCTQDFKRQSSLFFKIVSSVKNHHSAPHLAQLLLRVDYNKYFSTQNPLISLAMMSK